MIINHLGIIPDGNRRWAKANGKTVDYAYKNFSENIINIVLNCSRFKVSELSLYLISKENLNRTCSDVASVLNAIKHVLEQLEDIAKKNNIKITFPGVENVNDGQLIMMANNILDKTKYNNAQKVNLLIGYNPFDEIQLSFQKYGNISIENLLVNSYVDLIIRTAGSPIRLSNFLPLQSGYANIEVINKYFNDLSIEDIIALIDKYKNVTPNYGK